jgi:hypothetical protein
MLLICLQAKPLALQQASSAFIGLLLALVCYPSKPKFFLLAKLFSLAIVSSFFLWIDFINFNILALSFYFIE